MDLDTLTIDRLLRQYDRLIHKTLSRMNMSQNHRDYDDFAQELRLKLIDLHKDFDGDVFDEDKKQFAAYGGRGLYWHGLNLFRQKHQVGETPVEALVIEANPSLTIRPDETSRVAIAQFFEQAKERLTAKEYLIFSMLAEEKHTMTELSELFDVSRQTMHQWKARIVEKLTPIKGCLKL